MPRLHFDRGHRNFFDATIFSASLVLGAIVAAVVIVAVPVVVGAVVAFAFDEATLIFPNYLSLFFRVTIFNLSLSL